MRFCAKPPNGWSDRLWSLAQCALYASKWTTLGARPLRSGRDARTGDGDGWRGATPPWSGSPVIRSVADCRPGWPIRACSERGSARPCGSLGAGAASGTQRNAGACRRYRCRGEFGPPSTCLGRGPLQMGNHDVPCAAPLMRPRPPVPKWRAGPANLERIRHGLTARCAKIHRHRQAPQLSDPVISAKSGPPRTLTMRGSRFGQVDELSDLNYGAYADFSVAHRWRSTEARL